MQGLVRFVKVDTGTYQDLAIKHNIRGLPTVTLFMEGRVVDRIAGALPEPTFRSWLQRWLH